MRATYPTYIIFLELICPVSACRFVSRSLKSGITLGKWTTCIGFMHRYSVVIEALQWANPLSKLCCQLNVQSMTKTEQNRLRIKKRQTFKNYHWNSGSRWVILCCCTSSQLLNTFSKTWSPNVRYETDVTSKIRSYLFHVMMYQK
jgi:hypothetical protein